MDESICIVENWIVTLISAYEYLFVVPSHCIDT